MFVVRTMNQLEEAVRVGAREILVNGKLAPTVKAVCLIKSCKDKVFLATGVLRDEMLRDISDIRGMIGGTASGQFSLLLLSGEFSVIDTQGESGTQGVILRKIQHH